VTDAAAALLRGVYGPNVDDDDDDDDAPFHPPVNNRSFGNYCQGYATAAKLHGKCNSGTDDKNAFDDVRDEHLSPFHLCM